MISFARKTYSELINSNFFKNLFVLTSGVGVSQLIPFFLLPILTNENLFSIHFTPTDFGVFALFMAVVQLLTIPMTLRLEMAVVLPKKDTDAALLCLMSFVALFFFSCLLFIILLLCGASSIISISGEGAELFSGIPWVIYLLPIGILMLGVYNILYSWNNRLELYNNMSYSHILHSAFSTPASILFYFSFLKPIGLILGQIIGRFFACFLLFTNLLKTIQLVPRNNMYEQCVLLVKEYKKFIIFETPQSVINFLSQKYIIGVFTATACFGLSVVGIFDLADKIIGKPLGIISNSFKTVFYQRLTTAKNKLLIFKKSIFLITCISFILIVPFYIIPESFYKFVLGDQWGDTGRYIQLICPLLFSRFIFNVVTPSISYTLKNHYLLIWQIIYFISLVVLFFFLIDSDSSVEQSVEPILLLYALFGAFMYAVLGCISFLVLKNNIKN